MVMKVMMNCTIKKKLYFYVAICEDNSEVMNNCKQLSFLRGTSRKPFHVHPFHYCNSQKVLYIERLDIIHAILSIIKGIPGE
jgi:hypothetical protein